MVTTRLGELARIRKDPQGATDFLICDAKDGDMGGGIPWGQAATARPPRPARSRPGATISTRSRRWCARTSSI